MEFAWTAAQDSYRNRVRNFLTDELPANWFEDIAHGLGTTRQIEFSREFCPKLAQEGLLVPQWPSEYGGSDGEPWERVPGRDPAVAGRTDGPRLRGDRARRPAG